MELTNWDSGTAGIGRARGDPVAQRSCVTRRFVTGPLPGAHCVDIHPSLGEANATEFHDMANGSCFDAQADGPLSAWLAISFQLKPPSVVRDSEFPSNNHPSLASRK